MSSFVFLNPSHMTQVKDVHYSHVVCVGQICLSNSSLPIMHQMLAFTSSLCHDDVWCYSVVSYSGRGGCNSSLKAVYLAGSLCLYYLFTQLVCFYLLVQECTVFDMEEKILGVVSILLYLIILRDDNHFSTPHFF